ncbi:MAG: DUF4168 domain-containing protein [Cyanobacteria bacterium P01_F01_bin.86]
MSRHLVAASFLAGILGTLGVPSSWVPTPLPLVTQAAIAQTDEGFTSEEITQYARAVLDMDIHRIEAYTEIKDILLSLPTPVDIGEVNMSCSDNQDISAVPRSVRRDVREILFGYCNQAQEIVRDNGLSPRRFNEITSAHQDDTVLSEKIQQELIRLQEPE